MVERASASVVLRFRDYGTLLVTRDQGEPIRAELLQLVSEHQCVHVDLDDVEAYTPSFVDEVLGKSLLALGVEQFRKEIKLKASSAETRKLVNLILSNRARGKAP